MLRFVTIVAGASIILCNATSVMAGPIFTFESIVKRDNAVESSSVTAWFNQTVDHFGTNGNIWQQQYIFNPAYYKPGGPIFVLTPGEAPVSTMYSEHTHFTELAQKSNGMVVAIEHRFFGQSNPLPDLSTTSLAYMTLDNSLEDFAQFIRALKQTPQTIFPSVSGTPVNSTVVFTGGSYGGSIAAWMRAKYPDLVFAAWASSAPVFSFNSFYQLDQAFGQHLGERGCNETFAQAVAELDEIIMSTNTTAIDEVKVKFGLPGLANDDFVTQLANIVSSSINTPVTVNNDMIDRSICSFFNGMRAPLDSYVLAVSAIINGYTPPSRVSTFNAPSRYLIQKRDNNVDVSVNQAYRSWNYISCTWFADWQVPAPSSLNLTSYRSQLITSEYWESGCTESFGSSLALPVNVSAHNEKWLSILKNTTKIFFTVGSIDPWRGSTVAPESGYIVQGSDTVVITVMNGATHTQDMQMQSKYDLSEVTTAREMGDRLIMEWIQ